MSQLYMPYMSDSGSDSGSESDSTNSSETSSGYAERVKPSLPNFRALAQGLSLSQLSGPDFDISGVMSSAGSPLQSGHPTFANYTLPKDASGSELKSSSQSITSIIMLNSGDRDRNIFVQPTNVTLRLPRTYSNVTNFQVVQMKLLSAFFYFRPDKHNTDITIQELDRTVLNEFERVVENIITTYIRQGTYDINSLIGELNTKLNVTPIFYDFPNGFQDFAPRFAATGDFSIGFNFPGDNYYDSLLDQYIPNPTTTSILSHYFQSQYAGLSSYTTDQMKVAYYYPVVKEYFLDNSIPDTRKLNTNIVTSLPYLLANETVQSRCV